MLATVDPQEYAARRARLGIVTPKNVIRREVISLIPPAPAKEEPEPYEHKEERVELSTDQPISLDSVSYIRSSRFILEMTARKYGVTIADLKSKSRERRIIPARQEVCYRLSRELKYSLPKIGRLLGNRDHSTVFHGIKQHEERLYGQEGNGNGQE